MKKYGLYVLWLFLPLLGFATPPPASEVFQLTASPVDPNTFSLHWKIKKGFFLYKNRISFTEARDPHAHLGPISFPEALRKTDALGKHYRVYRHELTLPVAVLGAQPGEDLLTVHFQGCSDDGFCYPPETAQLKLTIDKQLALVNLTVEEPGQPEIQSVNTLSEQDQLSHLFSTNNWGLILLSFFGFGLLLSFTPCVLPMVPILSGLIVGQGKDVSTKKAFLLSLCYVLSMSVTYAVVGALVAGLGKNLQIAMQSPWVISSFSLIFVFLALSMFNVYELRLPNALQAKLAGMTRGQSSGHYLGAIIMGCLSTLILSPCVTAPLIGALSYIAESGQVGLGSLSLFFLSLGMGTPLLLIGTSAGKLLPKAGQWMNTVKAFFGVMLLAVALYLIQRLLPMFIMMNLWAFLLIFSGVFMGAFVQATTTSAKWAQGVGLILFLYGILLIIGASAGHLNPLQPLRTKDASLSHASQEVVTNLDDLQRVLKTASGKPVMLDFYADWCTSCQILERTTLQNDDIQQALKRYEVVKIDITANDEASQTLLQHFHVVAPPTFLFLNTNGQELAPLRLVGDVSVETLLSHLNNTSHNESPL